jgi:hypothetical protein
MKLDDIKFRYMPGRTPPPSPLPASFAAAPKLRRGGGAGEIFPPSLIGKGGRGGLGFLSSENRI